MRELRPAERRGEAILQRDAKKRIVESGRDREVAWRCAGPPAVASSVDGGRVVSTRATVGHNGARRQNARFVARVAKTGADKRAGRPSGRGRFERGAAEDAARAHTLRTGAPRRLRRPRSQVRANESRADRAKKNDEDPRAQ